MQSDKLKKAQSYLKKYGHTDSPELSALPGGAASDSMNSPETAAKVDGTGKMSAALKRFQKFTSLPATGRINKATLEQMKKPRCGFPDLKTDELQSLGLHLLKWNTLKISYGFQNFTAQFSPSAVRQAVRLGFNIWTTAVPFQFQEVPLSDAPKIVIRFASGSHGDSFPFDGAEGDLAHAFPPNSSLGGLAGDAHFDEDEIWSVTVPTADKDLVSVAAHEIGHCLGLGHSDVEESLMYALYEGEHRFLHEDDIDNIRNLYGV